MIGCSQFLLDCTDSSHSDTFAHSHAIVQIRFRVRKLQVLGKMIGLTGADDGGIYDIDAASIDDLRRDGVTGNGDYGSPSGVYASAQYYAIHAGELQNTMPALAA